MENTENNSAKHFALQLGSLISLYVSIGALIQVLFGVITIVFPDQASAYWEYESATSGIRWAIALLIVFFPAYIALTRVINTIRRQTGVPYLGLTKWLIYLSLLVGGLVLLGDLVSVIFNFLNGELTIRFFLKALTVLVVVGSAFVYYLYDARGYWQTREAKSKQYALGACILVLASIVVGYINIEAPTEVRERSLDQNQITDLGMIQSYIMNDYATANTLPDSLADLDLAENLPTAPDGRDAYTYKRTSDSVFELCAEFAFPSDKDMYASMPYMDAGTILKNPDDWTHAKGSWCFTRSLNIQGTLPPAPTKALPI